MGLIKLEDKWAEMNSCLSADSHQLQPELSQGKPVGDLYSSERLFQVITGLREVVALDSDKWYLSHILFNVVNYIFI